MYSVLNCHNIAKDTQVYLAQVQKRLHLKVYRLHNINDTFECKSFLNTRHRVRFGIPLKSSVWNTLHIHQDSHLVPNSWNAIRG
jgi:hypothetical protein